MQRNVPSHLFIDSGALFFKPHHKEKSEEVALANSLAIIKCFNFMHYDAIGIATDDLQMGIPFLKQVEREADFPFLSANIVSSKSGELIFPPFTTITKGNINIALIGITGQAQQSSPSDILIRDGQQSLNTTLETIPQNIDMVILLSSLSREENSAIAKKHNDIHIIFAAGQSATGKQLQMINNTVMTHTPEEGKYIGELLIDWQQSRLWQTKKSSFIELKNEIDRLNWFKKRIEKRGGAQKTYLGNPGAIKEYNEKMRHLQDLQQELAQRSSPQMATEETSSASTFQQRLHPLKPSIIDEPQTSKILKNSRKVANTLRRQKNVLKRFDRYVGSTSCRKCHEKIYQSYTKTKHSTAFATLVNKSDDNNPNCVFCHVTGLPERLAYTRTQIPQRLQQVGCETCHGPGKKHNQNPKTHPLSTPVTETTCLACHTEDHSNDFNFTRDVNLIH